MKKILFYLIICLLTMQASAQIIVSGEITSNTTWTNNNIYIISGWLYVRDGAALTIEPGTLIKGDFDSKGALIIERGAQLIADGTAEQPIVFTSQKAPGERYYGDWGGVIICGRASINVPENVGNGTAAGENIIEGGVGSVYGGGANPNDDDNSGILRYVRIEYGGIAFQPNSEINGLTCGGVGRGTTIDHVQVSFSGDDAFEFFGGTVNCTNLIAYRNWDDDFDTDFGYRGKIQWALSVRDPEVADVSGSNGFESDNDGQGTGNTPITSPVFSNVTIIGPLAFSETINSNYKRALHLRRNTRTSAFNSVFVGYPVGLFVDGSASQSNATNNDLRFKNNALVGMTDTLAATSSANPNNINGAFDINNWFSSNGNSNSMITSLGELILNDVSLEHPILTLNAGSPLESGASFTDGYLSDSFFTPTSYRGAFGTDNWTNCWAEWDSQNAAYNGAINYSITASIGIEGSSVVCPGESVMLFANTSATGDLNISWSNGDEGSEIIAETPLNINFTIVNDRGCSAISEAIDLTNYPAPSVAITAAGSTSFCTGGSVTISSNQSSGNVWSNDATSSSITVNSSGTYSLTYTDENGCAATSNSIEVSVSDSPAPTISTSGTTEICEGETVVLTSSIADTYQWNLNGNAIANGDTQTLTATEEGAYTVTVTNSDQCNGVGTSSFLVLSVNPTPAASFDYDAENGSAEYEFNNNSTNASSYSWDFGDGFTSTDANPTHTFSTGGSHTITLTAFNGDCSDVTTITITDVSIEENFNNTSVQLYPNPTDADATLQVSTNNRTTLQISISDITGKQVLNLMPISFSGTQYITIPASQIESGIYFLNIFDGSNVQVVKMVVRK